MQISRAIGFVWKGSPFWMVFNIIFQVLQGIFPILSLFLLKMMIDEVSFAAQGNADPVRLIFIIVLTGLVATLTAVVDHLAGWGRKEQARHISDYMNGIFLGKAGEVEYPFFEDPKRLNILERAHLEAQSRPSEIVTTLGLIIQNGVSLTGVVILILDFHPLIAGVLFLSALPGLVSRLFFSKKEFNNEKNITEKERKASYHQYLMLDRVCAKEVRLFNLTRELKSQFSSIRDELRALRHNLDKRDTLISSLSSVFMTFLVFAAYIWVALDVISGSVSVGAFVMFYQAFQRGQGFLRAFLRGVANLYTQNLYLGNLFKFLDYPNPLSVSGNCESRDNSSVCGDILFDDVYFTYPKTKEPVLKGLNLRLRPGEVVALVGENGCGKTTLVKLLSRLYDVERGAVKMDGIDLKDLSQEKIKDQLGVIFQDFMEYNFTVAQNIAYGDMSRPPDPERIKDAAKKAGIHEFILSLPQGYDTILGVFFTRGFELSGGQWQRIAVARALYKNAPVIILDEPTSSLDPLAEYELYKRFKSVLHKKTALIISHRMATVRMADRICVMDKGCIAEEGTHEELLALKGSYYKLFTTQARNYL